jgi:hypothetical protein
MGAEDFFDGRLQDGVDGIVELVGLPGFDEFPIRDSIEGGRRPVGS